MCGRFDLYKSYFRLTLKWFRSNKTKTTNEQKYEKMILLSKLIEQTETRAFWLV